MRDIIKLIYRVIEERYEFDLINRSNTSNYVIYNCKGENESVEIKTFRDYKNLVWIYRDGKLRIHPKGIRKLSSDLELIINKLPLHVKKVMGRNK